MTATLIPILGDQLSRDLSALDSVDPAEAVLLMVEVEEETNYVRHHKAKIAYILSAMRHHADDLRERGWTVDYVKLDDRDNAGSFTGELARAVERHEPGLIRTTEAGEWRVRAMQDEWADKFDAELEICADTRFICSHAEFEDWAGEKKSLRMEYFYREMRRKTGLLMDEDGKPEGGEWNYDSENRKPATDGGDLFMPRPIAFRPDAITQDVIALVNDRFADHPGTCDNFAFAVTHDEAMRQRRNFLDEALPKFGDYQDAMLRGEPFLWHSLLSPYINSGLLDPLDLCAEADRLYREGKVPLNCAEGYIRQIIGWREFIRGIYWRAGPDYTDSNFLDATRDLPSFYYSGDTDMECLRQAIGQTLDHGYAHHIQRLMVTGNFAQLAGVDPHQVHIWYLEVYADAYEWVEAPNVIGMSQFADGGTMSSKPYISSGSYIDRMSDYCGACRYDVKTRIEEDSCPFNALYWDFLARNDDKLRGLGRLNLPYRNWDKMDKDDKIALRAKAREFLKKLE